jgi:hypothetical protein
VNPLPQIRILSLGAGVQSTTLALMAAAGEIGPMPDAAIFADTGWEPKAVYDQLAWLQAPGRLPFPIEVVSAGDIKAGILARRQSSAGRYAAVPWYNTAPDGSTGIGRRQCSSEYKIAPIMRAARRMLGKGPRDRITVGAVEVWIGISIDEAARMKPARQRWMTNRWPLIEHNISRAGCLKWMAAQGHPEPPKSSCIGCPFHSDRAWLTMREQAPAEFAEAVAVDAALRLGDARGFRAVEYMHDARIPLAEAVEQAAQSKRDQPDLFQNECEGICGV